MPGDGITDVAPIAQNQEKGRSAAKAYYRLLADYTYFDGWIELLWAWWPGVQDAPNYPYRTRSARQRDPRIPQIEARDERLFVPAVANVAAQWSGEQDHMGQMPIVRKSVGLPYQYRPSVVSIEAVIDPITVSNIAAWLPAAIIHEVRESRQATKILSTQNNPFVMFYGVRQESHTSLFTQVTELIGDTQITGGHFVF